MHCAPWQRACLRRRRTPKMTQSLKMTASWCASVLLGLHWAAVVKSADTRWRAYRPRSLLRRLSQVSLRASLRRLRWLCSQPPSPGKRSAMLPTHMPGPCSTRSSPTSTSTKVRTCPHTAAAHVVQERRRAANIGQMSRQPALFGQHPCSPGCCQPARLHVEYAA